MIQSPAPGARCRFRVYWLFVRPFSGLLRRVMLRAIRREAELGHWARGDGTLGSGALTVTRDRFLTWDFDGTLARRPGNWTGVVCEVVAAQRRDLQLTVDRVRPHLQSGFPWHTPEVIRAPRSADDWWRQLLPVLAGAIQQASGVEESEARRLAAGVRSAYTDPKGWQVFDDVRPALERLRDRGWRHLVLSNHVPELPALIEALGLNDVISAVHSSARTGAEKPHPQAFEAVFAEYPSARAGWMIGDSWRADVQGALAVGMRAILVRSKHAEALIQCDTLHDVVDVVDR